MFDADQKSKNWFLRFRLRTLMLVTVLIAAYFALGAPTKTMGVRDVSKRMTRENNGVELQARYFAPLLLESSLIEVHHRTGKPEQFVIKSDYYLWLFGLTFKIPYRGERTLDIAQQESNSAVK